MAKKCESKEKRAKQKTRTHNNLRRKYERLLAERPDDLHAPEWRKKLGYFKQ